MTHPPMRAFLGFVAGALAVLTFHQGLVEILHVLGLAPQAAYRVTPVLPFSVPMIVSLSFWGGMYGLVFGLYRENVRVPLWLGGLCLGLLAAAIGMVIVAPIKGNPVFYGWQAWPIARSFLVNGFWGVGFGVILPLIQPRPLVPSHLDRSHASHAA